MVHGGELGQTKIQNFCLPAVHEKDIRGLDVAVHDSLRVRGIETVGDLNANLQQLRYFDGLSFDAMLESFALEQFHGDKGTAFELSDVVDSADVGMIERGGSASFAAKSLDGLGVVRNIIGKEFQRYIAAQARVFGFVNHSHASTAQFFEDAVVRDGAANIGGRIWHRACIVRQRLSTGNHT